MEVEVHSCSHEHEFKLGRPSDKAFNERMQTTGVKPTLEELQAFRHGGRTLGSD